MEVSQTSTKTLHDILQAYEQAIATLNHPTKITEKTILEALLVRDRIHSQLQNTAITTEEFLQLDELDDKLKQAQHRIQACAKLSQWRERYQPLATAWWWETAPSTIAVKAGRYDWLWNGLSLIFLAVSASLILNTASRFWGGTLASAGTLTLAAQSALTLIVGKGALTQSGREGWENFLKQRGIADHHWQEWSCAAAGSVLVVVAGLHASLPAIAIAYNTWGERHYLANRLASALSNYQVALNLRPDYPEARYNLGLVYEDLQRDEAAIAAYRFVVEQDVDAVDELIWLQANNNLARLYILQGNTPDAVPLLIQGLAAVPPVTVPPEEVVNKPDMAKINYSLLKNLGWARLEQERYAEAETQLDEAILVLEETLSLETAVRNRGSSYCLMAQVLDAQKRTEEADRLWETCLIKANSGNPDEDTWIGLYEQRSPSVVPNPKEEVSQ